MGTLYVVGIGPGKKWNMTIEAEQVLKKCRVIAGYTGYIRLVEEMFEADGGASKEYIKTPMRGEVERCRMALEAAVKEEKTAMVCSGDAGVYGMAGILLELSGEYPSVEIRVVPGVTAALSGGALLGAPIGHDFAVISLSDLLTPWETIEQRLRGAAMADFVVCLYNPASNKRKDYLKRACGILMEYKDEETVCGYTRNIGREGEESVILTLKELKEAKVDMFTTVFVGNAQTRKIGMHMVTPRGYGVS